MKQTQRERERDREVKIIACKWDRQKCLFCIIIRFGGGSSSFGTIDSVCCRLPINHWVNTISSRKKNRLPFAIECLIVVLLAYFIAKSTNTHSNMGRYNHMWRISCWPWSHCVFVHKNWYSLCVIISFLYLLRQVSLFTVLFQLCKWFD